MTQTIANESPDLIASSALTIGILALQGDYNAHATVLAALGQNVRLVRTAQDLEQHGGQATLDGLILPGGESTTMLKALERNDFFADVQRFVRTKPCFGTCAGCILLANDVQNPTQQSLAALDITVSRNAYGRQNESSIHTASASLPEDSLEHLPGILSDGPLEMVFIRAPKITRLGTGVETLAVHEGNPVLVRSGHILAATFHPELSDDSRIHTLFLSFAEEYRHRQTIAPTV